MIKMCNCLYIGQRAQPEAVWSEDTSVSSDAFSANWGIVWTGLPSQASRVPDWR